MKFKKIVQLEEGTAHLSPKTERYFRIVVITTLGRHLTLAAPGGRYYEAKTEILPTREEGVGQEAVCWATLKECDDNPNAITGRNPLRVNIVPKGGVRGGKSVLIPFSEAWYSLKGKKPPERKATPPVVQAPHEIVFGE